MSLLLNEDFTLYNLRLGYLRNIDDGVGERLITVDSSVLQTSAFRAAGYTVDAAATKRCYSPPIPTTGVADYFTRPVRSRQGHTLHDESLDEEDEVIEEDDDEDVAEQEGLAGRRRTSEDTLGTAIQGKRRRRRRGHHDNADEDDSSDLSDDSEEEDEPVAQSVRFARLPGQKRPSESSSSAANTTLAPEVNIISPSYRPRTSSLNASEAIRGVRPTATRKRADTITSSEFSSENELLEVNPTFRRKLPSRPGRTSMTLANKIAEEDAEISDDLDDDEDDDAEDEDNELAEASDLSDDFEGDDIAVPSPDILAAVGSGLDIPSKTDKQPKKAPVQQAMPPEESLLVDLPGLPDGHSAATLPQSSLLSMALKGDVVDSSGAKSFQKYAELSGQNEPNPIWIKIYYPSAADSSTVLQVPIKRQTTKAQGEGPPSVTDLIGLALYRYDEEGCQPPLQGADTKSSQWELRMVDDGEVEMDFPALSTTRAITDFTSNNNRPPARRARDKPWDEFGLVRVKGDVDDAPDEDDATPHTNRAIPPAAPANTPALTPSMNPSRNPITSPYFALTKATVRKDSSNLLDLPAAPTATFTPRSGANTEITIHFTDPQSFQSTQLPVNVPADTYIAEVFDTACTRLRLDKALYVLRVRGTQTVAPPDRTVEALGVNLHLDLTRRRFGAVGDFGLGTSGSPGSTSPNAPLNLVPNTPPISKDGKRRKEQVHLNANTAQAGKRYDAVTTSTVNFVGSETGRRYNVLRKQPLSFSASHPRTLIITPEYLQIMPSQDAQDGPVSGKITSIHMSSIIGVKVSRKHPKVVRVVVYREKEAKRYDFECSSREEAASIVADVRVGVGEYGEDSSAK